jgi:hypothetical protein
MTRISKFTLLLTTVLALGGVPEQASAQCDPNAAFCADAQGPRGRRATIQVVRRPRTVVVQPAPAPPAYVVQPAPAQQVVVVAPPPSPPQRVVVIQPAPPPPQRVVVVQQPPPPPPQQVVVMQPQPQQQVVVTRQRPRWTVDDANRRRFGFHGEISGIVSENVAMGGIAAGLRLRPIPFLGIDLTAGLFYGEDFVGNERVEVPFRVSARFFFNPRQRLQFYGLVGTGVSFAAAENLAGNRRNFAHVGGELGAGLEFRLNPHIAVNFDVRGFLRQRVDSDPRPEYVEVDEFDNVLRTTNTSAGATLNLGGTIYF